jgi:AcrR family transcriptional regulator
MTRQRGASTRAAVLAAARECVREAGPFDVSSNEIARRAGVTWGVIQHHFGTRAGILLAMVEEGFAELLDALDALHPTDDPLTAVVDAAWRYYCQPDYLLYADVIRMLAHDAASAPRVQELLRESELHLDKRISALMGADATESTLRVVRRVVFATMRGLALSHAFAGTRGPVDDLEERALLVGALHLVLWEQHPA